MLHLIFEGTFMRFRFLVLFSLHVVVGLMNTFQKEAAEEL